MADVTLSDKLCSSLTLGKPAPRQMRERRQEAALTSGALAWNKMPTTFQRIRSAKQQRTADMMAATALGPKQPPAPSGPGLLLHPQPTASPGRSIVVSLSQDSGCVRPKTANFPARNYLSGYRQIPSRAASRRERSDSGTDSQSSFLLGSGNPAGSANQDLDRMNEEELRQIFDELASAGEEDQKERQKKTQKKKKNSKPTTYVLPPATALQNGIDNASPTVNVEIERSTPSAEQEPSDHYGNCTPTSFRLRPQSRATHSAKSIGSGKILQSNDTMVYVPKLKTRYCRVFVGSNVARPRQDAEEYEFLPMNQRAFLHNPQEKYNRKNYPSYPRQPPVVYSSNFFTNYDHGGRDIYGHHDTSDPDFECVMCQHLLRSS